MRKTKIFATIGPSSYKIKTLVSLINEGMDGIRINLSHDNLTTYETWFDNILQAEKMSGKSIPILADIQGPEIRTGTVTKDSIRLEEGNSLFIYPGNSPCTKNKIYINYPKLTNRIEPGQIIYIDDGLIKLKVAVKSKNILKCKIIRGGYLNSNKGVNIPDINLSLPSLTQKDRKDLKLGIKLGIDYIMLPFVRNKNDVNKLRNYLDDNDGENIGIMAKIENRQGINNFSSFIEQVEGVIIARGDLGVEVGLSRVPLIQKDIIKKCNKYNKFSIVVTHMLHTMINSPLPTRAEISDIANAVLDKCSGVMLTGETAIGSYPVEAIKVLKETVKETENWPAFRSS